jgi:hypothetical protein
MDPLHYIGVDPETNANGSPTVWVDHEAGEIIVQGWKADDALRQRVTQTPPPDHEPGIPAHEDVVRIPARLAPILREACDVAERRLG